MLVSRQKLDAWYGDPKKEEDLVPEDLREFFLCGLQFLILDNNNLSQSCRDQVLKKKKKDDPPLFLENLILKGNLKVLSLKNCCLGNKDADWFLRCVVVYARSDSPIDPGHCQLPNGLVEASGR